MAKNKKQQARTAYKKATGQEDTSASGLLALSEGHLIGKYPAPKTVCGLRVNQLGGTREGWRYGAEGDVTCDECNEGTAAS